MSEAWHDVLRVGGKEGRRWNWKTGVEEANPLPLFSSEYQQRCPPFKRKLMGHNLVSEPSSILGSNSPNGLYAELTQPESTIVPPGLETSGQPGCSLHEENCLRGART